jgi:hypothetical protein
VLVIGICEAYRVAVAWANPTEKGTFTLKDEYNPGQLGCGVAQRMRLCRLVATYAYAQCSCALW